MVNRKFINSVRSNPLIRQIGTVFSGGAIGQVVAILTAPIITRIFTPEDFGVFALFLSIASMVGNNSQLAYQQALVIPREEENAQDLFLLCMVFTLVISVLSGGIFWGLNRFGWQFGWVQKLDTWIYWLPFAIFFIGTNLTLSNYNNRHQKYVVLAASNVVVSSVSPCLRIGLGLLYGSSIAILVIAQIVAFFAQMATLLKSIITHAKLALKRFPKIDYVRTIFEFRDFPLYSMPNNLFTSFAVHMPVVILSTSFSSDIVGFYAIANRLILRPLLPIQDAVRQVYQRKVAENLNCGDPVKSEFVKITLALILIGVILFGILICWGKALFGFLLGAQWAKTGKIAVLLVPWLYTSFILPPTNAVLIVGRFNKFRLNFQVVATIIRLASLYYGLKNFADPIMGLLLFSIVSALANISLIVLTYMISGTLDNRKLIDA